MVESCCIQQIFIELPEIAGIESSDFLKAEKAVNHKDQPLRIVIYPKTNIPLPTITHYSLLLEFFPIVYFQIVFISFFSSNGFDKCSFIPASLLCFLGNSNSMFKSFRVPTNKTRCLFCGTPRLCHFIRNESSRNVVFISISGRFA